MRLPLRYQIAGLLIVFVTGIGVLSFRSTYTFLQNDKVATVRELGALQTAQNSRELREKIAQARQDLREAAARLLDPGRGSIALDNEAWAWVQVRDHRWNSPKFPSEPKTVEAQKIAGPEQFAMKAVPGESQFLILSEPLVIQEGALTQAYAIEAKVRRSQVLGEEELDRGPIKGMVFDLEALKAASGAQAAKFVWLASPSASAEFEQLFGRIPAPTRALMLKSTRPTSQELPSPDPKQNVFLAWAGVSIPNSALKLVTLSFVDREAILRGFRRFILEQAFYAFLVLGIGAFAAQMLARRLSKPIEQLVAATKTLETGDFNVRVDTQRKDEIGDLAGAFNHMAEALDERETALKAAQNALIQNEKLAALGTLSAGIAHEVKNPLAGILGNADLAASQIKKLNLTNQLQILRYIEVIQKETKRCRGIIDSLMRFSRQEKADMTGVDLELIAWEAIHLMEHSLNLAKVKIEKDFAAEMDMIKGNSNQIEQVLLNMLQNAGHAMPEGGTLIVSTARFEDVSTAPMGKFLAYMNESFSGPFCRISIKDHGSGMSPEVQKKIFEPFFTTKPQGLGTGLGLSVTMGILADHKARITLTSAPDKGTTFYLDFMTFEPRTAEVREHLDEILHRKAGGAKLASDVAPGGISERYVDVNLEKEMGEASTADAAADGDAERLKHVKDSEVPAGSASVAAAPSRPERPKLPGLPGQGPGTRKFSVRKPNVKG